MPSPDLMNTDQQLARIQQLESARQKNQLRLIPSENYVSHAVLAAVGSIFMNKYSEGHIRNRYYQGNINIDRVEYLAQKRGLQAFQLDPAQWRVNVQAVTGSIANLAAISALIQPHDKILSLHLYHGGHLSHGWQINPKRPVSLSAQIYQPIYYQVDPQTQLIDYAELEAIASQEKPRLIISGGTAYPREIDHARIRQIADQIDAYYLADIAHEAGLVLTGVNRSPFPYADVVTMTTRKTLRGPIGALIFAPKDRISRINQAVFPGLQGGPLNHQIAGIAVALYEAQQPEFTKYSQQVVKNAKHLAKLLIDYGFTVLTQGTDKHLLVIDLSNQGIDGVTAAETLEKANIIVNKNTIPGENASPTQPSGIRLGTPAITSRGMAIPEIEQIASWLHTVISNHQDQNVVESVAQQVAHLTQQFPAPGINEPSSLTN